VDAKNITLSSTSSYSCRVVVVVIVVHGYGGPQQDFQTIQNPLLVCAICEEHLQFVLINWVVDGKSILDDSEDHTALYIMPLSKATCEDCNK
jgi:hypothetical protein